MSLRYTEIVEFMKETPINKYTTLRTSGLPELIHITSYKMSVSKVKLVSIF